MADLLAIPAYLRRYSLFMTTHLDNPVVHPIARLQLSRRSILHYIEMDGVTVGPTIDDQLIRTVPGAVYVDNIIKLNSPIGSPQKRPGVNAEAMITEFRRRNRFFKPLRDLMRLETDDRTLVVYNYCMLSHLFKYPVSFRAGYYQWYNVYKDVINKVNEVGDVSLRQQFIEVDLPPVLPSLANLKMYRTGDNTEVYKKIRDPGSLTVADLFQWAGKHRGSSLLGRVDPKHYVRTHLLIRRLNGFVVVNLLWLDSFRTNLIVGRKKGFTPEVFELKVLKLLTTIHQATSPIQTETSELVVKDPIVDNVLAEEAPLVEDSPIEHLVPEGDEEMVDEDAVIAKLEAELEENDKIQHLNKGVEITDEDGNIVEERTIDTNVLTYSNPPSSRGALLDKADELVLKGLLSPGEHRRLERVALQASTLTDPYGSGKSFEEATRITEEDLSNDPTITSRDACVTDPSLAMSRVDSFNRGYIKDLLRKDIMRSIAAIQKAPVAITSYRVERSIDAANEQEYHIVKVTPTVGVSTTWRIPVPIFRPDGSFLYNKTTYNMRAQRSDIPIRKISPTRVGLASYYSKLFVERSERSRFDYYKWLVNHLVIKCESPNDPDISQPIVSRAVDYSFDAPPVYSAIGTRITAFNVGDYHFWFNRRNLFDKLAFSAAEKKYETKGYILVGRSKENALVMDRKGMVYETEEGSQKLADVGTIEQLTGLESSEAQTSMVEVKIYSRTLPVGFCLAYLIGIDALIGMLKTKPRRVPVGQRLNLDVNEFAVRFKDQSLVFDRNDDIAQLLMSGFNLFRDNIKEYDYHLYNGKDVYAAVMEKVKIGNRYLRELDTMNALYVDPITEDLLKDMGEPTTFTGLLYRSVEMLTTFHVPKRRVDPKGKIESLERIRGYERVAGTIYEVLTKGVRQYQSRAGSGRAGVQINPNDPLKLIVTDPTTSPVNNINPIHQIKEREVITYGGRGGRSRRAMTAEARLFTEEDKGFTSEATVDSGDVAIIAYLSPNANIMSKRGTIRMFDKQRDGASSIMSTAALLSPAADGDDPKRINAINVQHSHGIRIAGGETQSIRTGMERAIVSRANPEFAVCAQGEGTIVEVTDSSIIVEYPDRIDKFPLGLIHTNAEGSQYPHTLKTELKAGDKVSEFDVITYNTGFFKLSPFDYRRVDYMYGCVARIALREAVYTVEDSASISVNFAQRLETEVSKLKSIRVEFGQHISGMVKPGDVVDLSTILCTIEDSMSSDAELLDEVTRMTLRRYAASAPTAGVVGVVSKVELFYNGDLDELSESMAKLVSESDKARRKQAKRLGVEPTTGQIPRNVRVDGYNLEYGQAVIQVYITVKGAMGIGDKLVVANQGKSTVGEILFGNNRTLEGEPIDMIFGCKSFIDRILTSPFIIGTTNTLIRYIGEEAYAMYFDEAA